MNLFSSLFGSSASENTNPSRIKWIALEDLGQLAELTMRSEEKPVIIFKHSTRCSVSRMALKQFENEFNAGESVVPYFLDLLEHRDISNAIVERFDVVHQSPQLLLIVNGKCIYNASHSAIDAATLHSKL